MKKNIRFIIIIISVAIVFLLSMLLIVILIWNDELKYGDDFREYKHWEKETEIELESNVYEIEDVKEELWQYVPIYVDVAMEPIYVEYHLVDRTEGKALYAFSCPFVDDGYGYSLEFIIDLAESEICEIRYEKAWSKRAKSYTGGGFDIGNINIMDELISELSEDNFDDNFPMVVSFPFGKMEISHPVRTDWIDVW